MSSSSFSLHSLSSPLPFLSLSSKTHLPIIIHLPLKPFPLLSLSSLNPIATTEADVLQAIADSDGTSLPSLRTFENDGVSLAVSGPVSFHQALAAAAADGGGAAREFVARGMEAMVVETSMRGDGNSTVATRLFLPARKVIEKAKMIRSQYREDILFDTTSENTLALTFKQVVLSQLWTVELLMYRPGTERNMKDLNTPREVPPSFALSSSDDRIIAVLAEVICRIALESTERMFHDKTLSSFFRLFRNSNRVASNDSSVIILKVYEDEIIASAQSLFETFKSEKGNYKPLEVMKKNYWWPLSTYSKLEKIGGPEFGAWVREYVPAYRLQVDPNRFPNLEFEGWIQGEENRWEVHLTHSQMVDLANVLDMYYEDVFTLPGKQLLCGATAKSTDFSSKVKTASVLRFLSITLASGVVLVILGILGQLSLPYLHNRKKYPANNLSVQSSITHDEQHQLIKATKVEEFCALILNKIKDDYSWTGDVKTEKSVGAWIGDLPVYLKSFDKSGYSNREILSISPLKENDEELKASAQDVATYQVVMSAEGRIIGFQPTSRVAVNQWADNPLAKELYGGKKLSPGIIEPGLMIPRPDEVAVIELFISLNPDSSFALARPSR